MKTDMKAIDLVEILIKVLEQSDDIIKELESDREEIEEDISNMEDDLDCARGDLEAVESEITTVKNDAESLKQMVSDIMKRSAPEDVISVDLVEMGGGNYEVRVVTTEE